MSASAAGETTLPLLVWPVCGEGTGAWPSKVEVLVMVSLLGWQVFPELFSARGSCSSSRLRADRSANKNPEVLG